MTSTDQFYMKLCECGAVHLSLGPTILNVSPAVALVIAETLSEYAPVLRRLCSEQRLRQPERDLASQESGLDPARVISLAGFRKQDSAQVT